MQAQPNVTHYLWGQCYSSTICCASPVHHLPFDLMTRALADQPRYGHNNLHCSATWVRTRGQVTWCCCMSASSTTPGDMGRSGSVYKIIMWLLINCPQVTSGSFNMWPVCESWVEMSSVQYNSLIYRHFRMPTTFERYLLSHSSIHNLSFALHTSMLFHMLQR